VQVNDKKKTPGQIRSSVVSQALSKPPNFLSFRVRFSLSSLQKYTYYLRTGIGDKNILDAYGINVNLDLPAVGTNLRTRSFPHFLYHASLPTCSQRFAKSFLYKLGCIMVSPQDHFWVPFIAETDPKYESVEVLSDPARAAAEWKV
jgi:hypothetical protein